MYSGKSRRHFDPPMDVEMREQSCSRDEESSFSNRSSTKWNLLNQFHSQKDNDKVFNKLVFSDDEVSPEKQQSLDLHKQVSFGIGPDTNDSYEFWESRKPAKEKKNLRELYRNNTQFSFSQPLFEASSGSNKGVESKVFKEPIACELITCKKNLFGETDENKDPNLDENMYSSPTNKENKVLFDQFLEAADNSCTNYTHETAPKRTVIQRWKKGESCFRGKYSSGVTPKNEKKVVKHLNVKSRFGKKKRAEFEDLDDEGSKENTKNPFLQITPQVKRKIRKCSFDNGESMALDFSSPTRTKKIACETPMKSFARVARFNDQDEPFGDNEDTFKFYEKFNDRGSRFNEDFVEIWTLGKGHFGSVVKCQNKLDGIEYAIKITERQHPKRRLNMYEALQEAYALSALSVSSENPYIVRYYRGWIENEQLYIQMELCENSLYDQFKERQLNEDEILKVLRDIWLGLNELHHKGIVHLDLKLENILLGSSGKYKLGDLGLSRLIDKLKTDVPEGDARYLAQELLNNDPNAPLPDLKKCDVFSLGILAYELMEGQRVKQNGDQWHALREDRVYFSSPEAYSDKTKEMVVSMLNSDPALRPSIDDLLKTFLKSKEEREIEVYKTICRKLLMKCMQLNYDNSVLQSNQ